MSRASVSVSSLGPTAQKQVLRYELPRPPSVNHLFVTLRGRRYRSPHYRAWRLEACQMIMFQRQKVFAPTIACPYKLELVVARGRGDLGNCEKAVSDVLVEMQVVYDDALAAEITMRWGDVTGCVVSVEAI